MFCVCTLCNFQYLISALYFLALIKYCETLGQKKVDVAANLFEEREKNQLARNFEAETLTTDNQESQRTPALHGAGKRDTCN